MCLSAMPSLPRQCQPRAPLLGEERKVKTSLGHDRVKGSFWQVLGRDGNHPDRSFFLFEFSLLYPARGAARTRIPVLFVDQEYY